MATVALYDVDAQSEAGGRLPNLALMKIARFELERGNRVVRYDPLFRGNYDRVYASQVFASSGQAYLDDGMEIGGTGWDIKKALPAEIETLQPHYALYPDFKANMGFAMRGCRRACEFCLVPKKEGRARSVATIGELLVQDSDFLILLDNDFFGNPAWRERVDEIWRRDLTVNLSQGINIRSITEEQAQALAGLVNANGGSRLTNLHRTRGQFHFAWDDPRDEARVIAGIGRLDAAGVKRWRMACFVLIGYATTPAEDEHRVLTLRRMGIDPFVMPFSKADSYQARFARWANHKAAFRSAPRFRDYDPAIRYRDGAGAEMGALLL